MTTKLGELGQYKIEVLIAGDSAWVVQSPVARSRQARLWKSWRHRRVTGRARHGAAAAAACAFLPRGADALAARASNQARPSCSTGRPARSSSGSCTPLRGADQVARERAGVRAPVSEKQARSIKYQLTVAKLPLAKDVDDFTFKTTPINEATLVRDSPAAVSLPSSAWSLDKLARTTPRRRRRRDRRRGAH